MDDTRLIALLRRGDEKAFDDIFRKYAPQLYRFAYAKMRNAVQAEDVVQETFLKVWETRRSIDAARNFDHLLITIAKHKIYNIFRRRVIEMRYGVTKDGPQGGGALSDAEQNLYLEDLKRTLLKGIDLLSPLQREILTLKSNGLSNDEIAEALDMPKKSVENNIYKAYRQLRIELDGFRDVLALLPALVSCLL
jgi:RNA polymerase sigma-70 factor (ECF subfamily)